MRLFDERSRDSRDLSSPICVATVPLKEFEPSERYTSRVRLQIAVGNEPEILFKERSRYVNAESEKSALGRGSQRSLRLTSKCRRDTASDMNSAAADQDSTRLLLTFSHWSDERVKTEGGSS
jgi:hypothetical protein